jgi:hypothetical protein
MAIPLTGAIVFLVSALLVAQVGVIEKGKPTTLRGEIVEISCYQKKGVAGGTGEAHIACAKDCAAKGLALGLLTEGDGLFRIVGPLTDSKNAKLVPHIGHVVDVYGAQVLLSNSYDIRQNFEAEKVTPIKTAR